MNERARQRHDRAVIPASVSETGEQAAAEPLLLRRDAVGPVYRQLQEHIRDRITAGIWGPGTAIPTEQALARQFGVARMTIRQALDGLLREGLLIRIRGRGTFVTQVRVERELARMQSFSEDMRARGMTLATRLLARRVVPAPPEVSAALGLGRREAVIMLERLRLADDRPMALETSYLTYERCQAVLDADLEEGSLYAFLEEQLHLPLSRATEELKASLPTAAEAQLLGVARRQPLLVIHRTTYMRGPGGDEPLIQGRTVYRADRYYFRLEVFR